jgi:SAM-dependent methyltransferase
MTSDNRQTSIDTGYEDLCLNPPASHPIYLDGLDLKEALVSVGSQEALRVLDYGCGSSPYQGLWPKSEYIRADYMPSPGVTHILEETGTVPEPDASFDMVLSTQVMEHVRDPEIYLREVARLLKPGGKFICTTHGTFHDHGCPWDFQRWTLDGLCRDVERVGLKTERAAKLTAGPRALMTMLQCHGDHFRPAGGTLSKLLCGAFRKGFRSLREPLNRWAGRAFPSSAILERSDKPDSEYNHQSFYIGIMVVASKPGASPANA